MCKFNKYTITYARNIICLFLSELRYIYIIYRTEELPWKAVIKFTNKLDFVRGNSNILYFTFI